MQTADADASTALPNVHWTDGWFLDLAVIADACRHVGALLCLDLTPVPKPYDPSPSP